MSEFDPSRRRVLKKLGATIAGCALAGDGITLLGTWAGRVGEDVAKDLGVIEDKGNPLITVSKEELSDAIKTRENTRPESEEWKRANDIVGNELKAQVKLKENQYMQRAELNGRLLGIGGTLTVIGWAILSEPSVSRWRDQKR